MQHFMIAKYQYQLANVSELGMQLYVKNHCRLFIYFTLKNALALYMRYRRINIIHYFIE